MQPLSINIIQPALPQYRLGFFDALYKASSGRLIVHYSSNTLNSSSLADKSWSSYLGATRNFLFNRFIWQKNIFNLVLNRGQVWILCGDPRYILHIFFYFLLFKGCRLFTGVIILPLGMFLSRFFLSYAYASLFDKIFYTDRE